MAYTPELAETLFLEPPPQVIRPTFNSAIRIEIEGRELSSSLGVLAVREADHRLGFTAALAKNLHDDRDPRLVRYQMQELLLESIDVMLSGNPSQDSCDRQAHDPAVRVAGWARSGARVADEHLGSQPTASRLQDALARPDNLEVFDLAVLAGGEAMPGDEVAGGLTKDEKWSPSSRFPPPVPVSTQPWRNPPRHAFPWFRPRL